MRSDPAEQKGISPSPCSRVLSRDRGQCPLLALNGRDGAVGHFRNWGQSSHASHAFA